MRGELEVPVLFLEIDDLAPFRAEFAVRAALLVGQELLLADGVITAVSRLVELPLVMQALEDALDAPAVARIGGGGPAVVRNAELGPEGGEFLGDLAGVPGGLDAGLLRGLLDLLAVLVHAGEEVNGLALQPVKTGEDIREDFLVGVPDVGRGVRVINGGGDVKSLGHPGKEGA
jgi:hypothetical protein